MTIHNTHWIVLAALVGACGSAPLSSAAVARAKSSVSAAEAVGAEEHPPAALHLKIARDDIATAEGLAKQGEEEDAARALERADADAQLALSLTREQQMCQEAAAAVEQNRELTRE